MKPVVGVCPLYDEDRESIWMLPGYLEVLQACGAIPLVLPFMRDRVDVAQAAGLVDGILFTGGHDIDPRLYGQRPIGACGPALPARDELECLLLDEACARDLPIFGICRGIQLFCARWGGTLYQDLPTQHPSAVEHHAGPPYDRPAHRVELVPATPLRRLLGVPGMGVNSYHHQAICDLPTGLSPMARAQDGVVEAVWAPAMRFAWAVQWHPEFSWQRDPHQKRIVQAFVDACRQEARR